MSLMYRAINVCLDTNIQLGVTDVTAVIQKCKKISVRPVQY